MTEKATILLVEDDRPLLDGIADLLEISDTGYDVNVLTATNGDKGLGVLAKHTPDLIISDIMMPKMDGFEFLHRIRQNSSWVHIPVIFLTARGTKRDILEGRMSGAELYITKPYDSDEFLQLVKSQLDRAFELQLDRQLKMDILASEIVQILNHEFRTPLTYITAYYELLASGLLKEETGSLNQYLRGIQIGADRLTRLVDDLVIIMEFRTGVALTRYEQRAGPIEDLSQRLRAFCKEIQLKQARIGMIIHLKISSELPVMFGDVKSLLDALGRLIDNAIKFTPLKRKSKRDLWVSAWSTGNELRISVRDEGVGFPDQVKELIFGLFYQHNREELEQQGVGAGLTIVKEIVNLHGGHVEATSQEGLESTFTIILPVYAAHARRRLVGQPPAQAKRQVNVLIVEDESYLLEGLRDLLGIFESHFEFQVKTASDGMEALLLLETYRPDLIISDIMMPRLDGYGLLSKVRQNEALIHIPVIFLTARGGRQDVLLGRRSGVEEYITKPYDTQELFKLVITQLDRYFQRQGVIHKNFKEVKSSVLALLMPEFRKPVAAVSEYSQKLASGLENVQTDEELVAHLQGIQVGSYRLSRSIEDFILLVELRAGEAVKSFRFRAEPEDIGKLIEEAVHRFQRETDLNGLGITLFIGENAHPVVVDREMFKVCMARMLAIMVKLAQVNDATTISIHLSSVEREYHLLFRLGGLVLPADVAEEINFVLEQQELPTLGRSQFDPGLPVAKGVVHLHGGRIALGNDPECAFSIILPAYRPISDSKRTVKEVV